MTEASLTHKQQLLALLARISFRLGQFTLSSGGTSDYYIDCRTTTLHAEGGRLTGHAVLELLEQKGLYYAMWRQQVGEREAIAQAK